MSKEKQTNSTINKKSSEKHPKILFDTEKQSYYANIKIETERHVKRFAEEMIEYFANTAHAVKIKEYAVMKGVTYDRMHDWRHKYPFFKEAYERCLEMLEIRRYKMMIDKSNNPFPLAHTQHLYDNEWKKGNEYNDSRKQKIEEVRGGNVYVEMIEAEKTEEVPERKKSDLES